MTMCTLCRIREADHLENGRSASVEPYPVCAQCGAEMDYQEHGTSPLDRRHYVTKSPLPVEPRTRLVAYCVEPGCKCLDRAGVIVQSHDDAPRGYEVREEIRKAYAGRLVEFRDALTEAHELHLRQQHAELLRQATLRHEGRLGVRAPVAD